MLWFAWKFVPLWYQQQLIDVSAYEVSCCDLLENLYLCGISNNLAVSLGERYWLWFAWKFVPLWYQQQQSYRQQSLYRSCDLLENLYLCGISNNIVSYVCACRRVVICLKICTFVVSATTASMRFFVFPELWFAWKFVPLWYQQQHIWVRSCEVSVVICLKICTFVVSATTNSTTTVKQLCCDLLENLYLCGISNNQY